MDITHDLQIIAHQERTLAFAQFHAEQAWQLGTQLREMALARDAAIVIDIRVLGRTLFHVALDNTSPSNSRWAERKARTVEHFHRSSYAIGLSLQQAGTTLTDKHGLNLSEYASHGGGFPLRVTGVGVIGAVTVSGLSQRDDHELAVEALCAVLGIEFSTLSLSRA